MSAALGLATAVSSVAPTGLGLSDAIALGVLQGIAEFLPISSSGHLSLAQQLLGVRPEEGGHSFNIILHAGTLLAVLVIYRRDLLGLLRGTVERNPTTIRMLRALVIGTLPLGLVLIPAIEDAVVAIESRPRAVGAALLLTAAMLFFSHRRHPPVSDEPVSPTTGHGSTRPRPPRPLFAVIPGVSRSGSTIAAALALGYSRGDAARFSFLLSIPAIGGATAKELLGLIGSEGPLHFDPLIFLAGFAVSALTGLLALTALLRLLGRFGMLPFVPYLFLVGLAAIVFG